MPDLYSILAPYYDEWNAELDYAAWADGLESFFRKNAKGEVKDVLDLACGTGRMTLELAKRGYDMIGVDRSPEMLDFVDVFGVHYRIVCEEIVERDLISYRLQLRRRLDETFYRDL